MDASTDSENINATNITFTVIKMFNIETILGAITVVGTVSLVAITDIVLNNHNNNNNKYPSGKVVIIQLQFTLKCAKY